MNKIIYFFLLLPLSFFGQNTWIYTQQGNSFDGHSNMSHVFDSTNELALVVLNQNDKVSLNVNKQSDFSQTSLTLNINPNENYLKELSTTEKILMSFDKDKEVYYVDFYPSLKSLKIRDVISKDLKNYVDIYELLNMIKAKSQIHFRLFSKNSYQDYTFTLNKSSSAINNVVKYNSGKNFSEIAKIILWSQKWGDLYQWKIAENSLKYLNNEYGKNAITLIDSINLSGDQDELIFKLKFGLGKSIIPRKIFIENAMDKDGNFIANSAKVGI